MKVNQEILSFKRLEYILILLPNQYCIIFDHNLDFVRNKIHDPILKSRNMTFDLKNVLR